MSESVNLGLVCNTYTLPLPSTGIRVLGQGQLSCVVVFFKNVNILKEMKYNANFNSKWLSCWQSGVSFSRLQYWNNYKIWSVKYGSWVLSGCHYLTGWLLLSVYKHLIMVFSIIHLSVNKPFLLKSQSHKR